MRFIPWNNLVLMTCLMLGMWSCEKEEVLRLDGELTPYFDAFAEAAMLRGISVDYDSARIEGVIEDIETANVTGQCERNSIYPDRVIIDQDYWNRATNLQKEFVVFHELGHCFLKRTHLDTKNPDGTCLSMMHSGETNCRNVYSNSTREEYLDELFGE